MTALAITAPLPQFFDLDGSPLDDGRLFIGQPNQNPVTAPLTVYWDQAKTQPAAQPLRVMNGYVMRSGTPANVFVDGDYSLASYDKRGRLLYSAPNSALYSNNSTIIGLISSFIASLASSAGSALIGFIQAGLGAIQRTMQDKQREMVSVKDFGAKGDNSTIDTQAFVKALAASQYVYVPPGQYRIDSTVLFTNQYLYGAVNNGTFSDANNQTMILPTGDFPAFQYNQPSGFSSQGGGLSRMKIKFGGSRPAVPSNQWGIVINDNGDTTGYCAWMAIEDIEVEGGMGVINDNSGAWMTRWSRLHGHNCYAGFRKKFGTTMVLENCYSRGAFESFRFESVIGVTMIGCAFDLSDFSQVGAGYIPCYFSESNVTMIGMDIEAPNVSGDKSAVIWADNNTVLNVSGTRILNAQINGVGGFENYMVRCTNSAKIVGDAIDCRSPTFIGTAGVFAYFAATDSGAITLRGGALPAVTGGTPTAIYSGIGTTGQITYSSSVVAAYPWSGNCYRVDESIRFKVTEALGTIAAFPGKITKTYTIPGVDLNDEVRVQSPGIGILPLPYKVTVAGQATVDYINLNSTPSTLLSADTYISVIQTSVP